MSMVNLPLWFLLYIVAISGTYGLVGVSLWVGGRIRTRATIEQFGYSLAMASGYIFLAYSLAVLLWVSQYDGANSFGAIVGASLIISSPLAVGMPPFVAIILNSWDSLRTSILWSMGLSLVVLAVALGASYVFISI